MKNRTFLRVVVSLFLAAGLTCACIAILISWEMIHVLSDRTSANAAQPQDVHTPTDSKSSAAALDSAYQAEKKEQDRKAVSDDKESAPKLSPRRAPRYEEEEEEPKPVFRAEEKETPPESPPPIPESYKPLNRQKTLFFEKTADGTRRVHILTEVCLREGALEVFLCKKNTKEHESILDADVDARDVHFALIAAGAKPGSTVRFVPEYKAATGSVIKTSVTFNLKGKLYTKPAQSWILDVKNKKDMPHDWVFAGSRFFKVPDDPMRPDFYCANNGEVISIANFVDSMMDLPVMSSKEQAELGFVANTERIPPLWTKVIVTLEPVIPVKK